MKRDFIKVDALVNEWLTDRDYQVNVEEDMLRRWASRRAEYLVDTEQLVFDVALIDIENFQGKLPDGFHSAYLVAGTDDLSKCRNREQLVSMTRDILGSDCDLEINIICPRCKHEKCACSTKSLEINVDEIYMMERPYLWEMTNSKYIGYSATTTDGFPTSEFLPDFFLLTPRSSNAALWNSEYFLGVCKAIGQVDHYTYDINPPEFLTNMKEGQVYMAYLKYMKDESGYYMIPNFPEAVEAIVAFLDEMMATREYYKGGNQTDRLRYIDTKRDAEHKLGIAKAKLEQPSPDKWTAILNRQWLQGRDRHYY